MKQPAFSPTSALPISPSHAAVFATTCSSLPRNNNNHVLSSFNASSFTRHLPVRTVNAFLYPMRSPNRSPISADSNHAGQVPPPSSPAPLDKLNGETGTVNNTTNKDRKTPNDNLSIPLSTTTTTATPEVSFPSHINHNNNSTSATPSTKGPLFNNSSPTLLPTFQAPQALNIGSHRMRIFSGSSNTKLADDIARYVGKSQCSAMMRKRFADGETYVRIEESVRGCNVFLIQPTSSPTNDNLLELLLMIDACRRASAYQITAVIPYYGYARADRLVDPQRRRREALTSKLVANMLSMAGIDRIILVDIHSPQTCGFFDIPVDHVYAASTLMNYINEKALDDVVVVAPDVGGVARARAFAKGVNDAPLAIIDKRRDDHNIATVLNLVGDVKDRTAIILDDMIDTAGTICEAAKMLRKKGARQVFALATHAVFSGPAVERLSSGVFEEVIVTNSIDVPEEKRFKQLTVLSIADVLGEQIWRVHEQSSR